MFSRPNWHLLQFRLLLNERFCALQKFVATGRNTLHANIFGPGAGFSAVYFDVFSGREPVSASLEKAGGGFQCSR
jgi:hypothetical protein